MSSKSISPPPSENPKIFSSIPDLLLPPISGSMFGSLEFPVNQSAAIGGTSLPSLPTMPHFDLTPNAAIITFIDEESKLSATLVNQIKELQRIIESKDSTIQERDEKILEINNNFRELKLKRDTISLSHQIHKRALDEVLENKEFESKLKGGQKHNNTFVVSIDIRRSTELMLKAKTPELFAQFITSMCSKLMEIVKTNGGIVDKFTGDGILAFFPEFFTGSDAGYHACKAATQAIETFQNLYVAHRASFKSVLSEVGLGVGIDFGDVYFSEMAGSLTVVGEAVVYACRMGAAPAGSIYLNQPAYEAILKTQYLPYLDFEEKCIEIKHEGKLLCHSVQLKFEEEQLKHIYSPQPPSWLKDL